MKTLTIYLPITILIYVLISLSESFLAKTIAFSYLVFIPLFMIGMVGIYFIIKIYREGKKCFSFNKIISIITILFFISLSSNSLLSSTYDSEKIFEYQVLSLNKKLPMMIDRYTRFDKVYIKDNNIFYLYTITNITSKKVNKDLITLALTDKIYSSVGKLDLMILKLSRKPRVINYIFNDKKNNFLTKVEIKLN